MKEWIKDVILRTIKTMAQAAFGIISSAALISDVDWRIVCSTVGIAGISCILMNIANIKTEGE